MYNIPYVRDTTYILLSQYGYARVNYNIKRVSADTTRAYIIAYGFVKYLYSLYVHTAAEGSGGAGSFLKFSLVGFPVYVYITENESREKSNDGLIPRRRRSLLLSIR